MVLLELGFDAEDDDALWISLEDSLEEDLRSFFDFSRILFSLLLSCSRRFSEIRLFLLDDDDDGRRSSSSED